MKELSGVISNLTLTPVEDGGVRGMVEVGLILSGDTGKDCPYETFLFMATPDVLRGVAESFVEWADDMDAFAAKHTRATAIGDAMAMNPVTFHTDVTKLSIGRLWVDEDRLVTMMFWDSGDASESFITTDEEFTRAAWGGSLKCNRNGTEVRFERESDRMIVCAGQDRVELKADYWNRGLTLLGFQAS